MLKQSIITRRMPQSTVPGSDIINAGFYGSQTVGRLTGAFTWPTLDELGFSLILSEDLLLDETTQKKHIRVLTEYDTPQVGQLMQWCKMQENNISRDIDFVWHTDLTNKPMRSYLHEYRKAEDAKGNFNSLRTAKAPYLTSSEKEEFYLQKIQEYIDAQSIHFTDESRLPGDLKQFHSEMKNSILTLGYAVSVMAIWPNVGTIRQ